MSSFTKKFLQLTGITLGILLLFCMIPGEGVAIAAMGLVFVCLLYFAIGLIILMFTDKGKDEWGKVMLLASAVMLVVGFSTCGLILLNMR